MKTGTLLIGALALIFVSFIVALFALKLGWAWVVPDVFPGAVESGLVISSLTWGQAAKLAIFLSILSTFFGGRASTKSK